MRLVPKQNICSVSYVDVDRDDVFDHNCLICNGCLYWCQVYNRCTYQGLGYGHDVIEREICESAQLKNECPNKKYVRYYDKNYKFFLKNKDDELYLKMRRNMQNMDYSKVIGFYTNKML